MSESKASDLACATAVGTVVTELGTEAKGAVTTRPVVGLIMTQTELGFRMLAVALFVVAKGVVG